MAGLYSAATAPSNCSGASPVLALAPALESLRQKACAATSTASFRISPCCTSSTQDGGNIIRRHFFFHSTKEMSGICSELSPHATDFLLNDGILVENVAPGPDREKGGLYLTTLNAFVQTACCQI